MSNKKDDFTMNAKRKVQLGMPFGTARARLTRNIMFQFAQRLGLDICFKCGKKIETKEELSIEHKTPWLDKVNAKELFFDLDNIAFSHLSCNSSARVKPFQPHGITAYRKGCRCSICVKANSDKCQRHKIRARNKPEV